MKAVGEVASGPDFREGVAAFLEKRPAKWRFES
jgi:enoyl-CoA hydratase/carnithine racemase